VFEFTFNVTYFHRVRDIQCIHSYFVYQTLNIIRSVVEFEKSSAEVSKLQENYRII
jgi:hypothetical protein